MNPAAPRPAGHEWTPVRLIEGKTLFALFGSDDREIALLNIWSEATYGQTKDMARERGEHIVTAVNAHADLLAALQSMREWVLHWRDDAEAKMEPTPGSLAQALAEIDAALAKATRGTP